MLSLSVLSAGYSWQTLSENSTAKVGKSPPTALPEYTVEFIS